MRRGLLALLPFAVAMTTSTLAAAAPSRVVILGPSDTPVLARLQRNVASMKIDALEATVTLCSRDVVTRLVAELRVDTALCTDGDQIGVWMKEGDRLVLKEAVAIQGSDDRSQELAAARAVMAMQALPASDAAEPTTAAAPTAGFTIVANGPAATVTTHDLGAPLDASPVTKDTASPAPLMSAPAERVTPRLVLGVGPGVAASRHGGSFAISAEAEIGVSRYVALVPWIQFVPENRVTTATAGTASFRPTIFGFGLDIPILPPSSVVVPRVGTGYGILWMHVAADTATAPATARAPEDLIAPIMYANASLSVKIAESFRIAGEGMAGFSTHDMVVKIGGEKAAHWGVPIAGLALRAEWVMR